MLAAALADAYRNRDDEPDLVRVIEAMGKADRAELHGVDHDDLIELPADWPFPRLALNPAQMALAAILPLRHGLVRELLLCEDPRRVSELQVVRDLEHDLVAMASALDHGDIAPLAALEWLIPRFEQAAGVIQPADLRRLLAGKPADIAGRVSAVTILTGPPVAQA